MRVLFLIFIDIIFAYLSLVATAFIRYQRFDVTYLVPDEGNAVVTLGIFVVTLLFSSHLMEVYDVERNTRKREICINVLFAIVTSFAILSIIYYLGPNLMLYRGALIPALLVFAVFQFGWHTVYLIGRNHPRFSQRVLVLGTGPLAQQVGDMLQENRKSYVLAGFATCNPVLSTSDCELEPVSGSISSDVIVGSSDDLMAAVRKVNASTIVVALSERRGVFPLRDVLRCKLNGIQVLDAPSFYEIINEKLMLESITPSWFIFSRGFRRTTLLELTKRIIDILVSIVGLIVVAPFLPVIVLAIKLDSPGPVFFKQVRVGNNERHFMLYKFRTMRQDAEQKTGATWAVKNDPRVTRLGKIFRSSRIDEIPQLYNVLKGDMSIVGPRPERPEFVEKLKEVIPYYSKRHFVKPGATGWAQVRYPYGASVEDAIEKLRYDLYYIKHIGPFLDTLILFETIKVVLFGRGGR